MKRDLTKFVEDSSKQNLLLKHRRLPGNKDGLGFKSSENKNNNSYSISVKTCRQCGKEGHIEVACKGPQVTGLKACSNSRINYFGKTCTARPSQKKRTRPNQKGPKKIWVPKSQIVYVAYILNGRAIGFKLVPG